MGLSRHQGVADGWFVRADPQACGHCGVPALCRSTEHGTALTINGSAQYATPALPACAGGPSHVPSEVPGPGVRKAAPRVHLPAVGSAQPRAGDVEQRELTTPGDSDHLTFVIEDHAHLSTTNPVVEISVTAYLGGEYGQFPIDLATELHSIAEPERIRRSTRDVCCPRRGRRLPEPDPFWCSLSWGLASGPAGRADAGESSVVGIRREPSQPAWR